jgi:hypothetical protein
VTILDFLTTEQSLKDPNSKRNFEQWQDILNKVIEYIHIGSGSPENVEVGSVGHIFLRTDNANAFYVKQTGNGTKTGWVLK